MMEARARILRIENGQAWVKLSGKQGGCGRCDEPGGCGSVRAMRRIRSWLRPVRPRRSKAPCISFSPASSSRQYRPIMAGVI